MIGLRRASTTLGGRPALGQPAPERLRRAQETRPRPGGLGAPTFAACVLVIATILSVWAPWREARSITLSDYSSRLAASPAATAPGVTPSPLGAPPTAALQAAAPAQPTLPVATPAAPAGETPRPLGLPVQRNDWIIIRAYVAHGGPGPNGAIDVGVMADREAVGTPIYATHDGTVRLLRNNKLYGNLVAVKNERWSTTYGHLDQIMVAEGQTVRRGEVIGTMGATGRATSPHVDYQVWEKVDGRETNRNPIDFIAPR